jgi:hypothetical protein
VPRGSDDFTIVLPELTDVATCELKLYEGLDRLELAAAANTGGFLLTA